MASPDFSSNLDLGLPKTPYGVPDELYLEFEKIYNAIRVLQQAIGDFTGTGILDPANYLTISPVFADSIQVQRMQAIIVTASEDIAARDFCNLHSSTGLKVRRANASALSTRAWGWAPLAITNGSLGIIYLLSGYQSGSGITLGSTYYLSASTPGGITTTAPSSSGTIKQEVGLALSSTELLVRLSTPIVNP